MTDKAPYEGAIEESAKAASKALDLVKASSQQIADVYGILIGDPLHAARHRRLDATTRRTQEILRERDAKTTELPEQIAIPLLEAAQQESRTEMQEIWARLLANAMDTDRAADVRPEFVAALQKLQPLDALLLQEARALVQNPNQATVDPKIFADRLSIRETLAAVSIENLVIARCLSRHLSGQTDYYRLAGFGIELLHACRP
ncbi:DUF4393 domain-containing protein [Bradyrhizobium sp. 156]|uniref:Abi-alpha family protein n=1 Tax=Bradyrhizobium sp. 156 TaxID=2782630 RepID=UPI001FFAEB58|nr:Abi-alpha family protein [Bradyrhizobium sp. 156]MCK1320424.1 DUF4393 domain-containing protein [Bradyrhizobium sp. 156]